MALDTTPFSTSVTVTGEPTINVEKPGLFGLATAAPLKTSFVTPVIPGSTAQAPTGDSPVISALKKRNILQGDGGDGDDDPYNYTPTGSDTSNTFTLGDVKTDISAFFQEAVDDVKGVLDFNPSKGFTTPFGDVTAKGEVYANIPNVTQAVGSAASLAIGGGPVGMAIGAFASIMGEVFEAFAFEEEDVKNFGLTDDQKYISGLSSAFGFFTGKDNQGQSVSNVLSAEGFKGGMIDLSALGFAAPEKETFLQRMTPDFSGGSAAAAPTPTHSVNLGNGKVETNIFGGALPSARDDMVETRSGFFMKSDPRVSIIASPANMPSNIGPNYGGDDGYGDYGGAGPSGTDDTTEAEPSGGFGAQGGDLGDNEGGDDSGASDGSDGSPGAGDEGGDDD